MKQHVLLVVLVFFLGLLNQQVYPQRTRYMLRFSHISIEDGLSQNTILSIFKDRYGFMWFGTQGGLNRYDGYGFKTYTYQAGMQNSVSHNFIYAITDDASGRLWIATGNGLNCFDPNTETFKRYIYHPGKLNGPSNNDIRALFRDKQNRLWIGTRGGGLNCLDLYHNTFTYYQYNPNTTNCLSNDNVNTILQDNQGLLWMGTLGGGLNRFNPTTGQFTHFPLPDNQITCLALDDMNNLWIGTWSTGIICFNLHKETFEVFSTTPENPYSISNNTILSILPGWDHHLWIGTDDGLNLYAPLSRRFYRYVPNPNQNDSLSDNHILSLYGQLCGDIWVGTAVGGVNRIICDRKEFSLYRNQYGNPNSISNNRIYAFYEDRFNANILWIGTRGGGLNRLDRSTNTYRVYRTDPDKQYSLGHNEVHALLQDSAGILWVGTLGHGLYQFIEKKEQFIPFKKNATDATSLSGDFISCIYEDRDGVLWIGTMDGGLNRKDPQSHAFIHYRAQPGNKQAISNDFIRTLFEDGSGTLWIGTEGGGLNALDKKNHLFTTYRHKGNDANSLSCDSILSFHQDQQGYFWIGTAGSGLNCMHPTEKTFTTFTTKQGLPDNTIYGILEDKEGNLWLSSNRGLTKFNRHDFSCRNYDVQDGLQSNEFNFGAAFQNKEGEMFFGGVNGFNSFFPDRIKDNPIIPPIVITDLKIFNKSVPIGPDDKGRTILTSSIMNTPAITLSYRDTVITLEYTALNFQFPNKNRYTYILENFEKEWNYVGSRQFANYTNLPPGTYFFKVKGSNNDGIWNTTGVTLKITVSTPCWQTWWFVLLAIGSGGAFILSIYRWQTHKERNLNKRLEMEVAHRIKEAEDAQKTAEEANKSKSQFLARMSHEIRTPLNGVLGFIPMLLDTPLTPTQLDYINSINSGGKALLTLVNDILDFSKIEAGVMTLETIPFNVFTITDEVCNIIRPRVAGKNIKISCFISPQVPTYIASDPSRFRQVLLNLMGNAAKFTLQGEIELAITVVKETDAEIKLHTTVQDTGIGIPPDKLESIFDVFQQADGSTTRHFGGTGLGLSICRQVALLMKGKVWAESEPGKGSIFHFTAWVNKTHAPEETSVKPGDIISGVVQSVEKGERGKEILPVLEPQGVRPVESSGVSSVPSVPFIPVVDEKNAVRVLLVEDNPLNQKLARYILTQAGYHTELAVNGQEAVDTISKRPDYFQLVLMDVQMPIMDGLAATQIIRAKGYTQIPIVAMTAQALKGDREKCLEAGMNDFITKPIKRDEIFNILQKWSSTI